MGGVPEHLKKAEATALETMLVAAPTITGPIDGVKPTSLSGQDDADAKKAADARGCWDHNPGPGAGWLVGSSGH